MEDPSKKQNQIIPQPNQNAKPQGAPGAAPQQGNGPQRPVFMQNQYQNSPNSNKSTPIPPQQTHQQNWQYVNQFSNQQFLQQNHR